MNPTPPSPRSRCHSVPPNLRFYVDDAELPWTFSESFDFIHCRMLTGAIKDWPKLFEACFRYGVNGPYPYSILLYHLHILTTAQQGKWLQEAG